MVVTPPTDARRLAETIADRIQRDIVENGWKIGSLLGSEPDLIERYGVSRAVFREAARIIEHQQIARMRRGPGGGLVVTEPDAEIVRRAAGVYLRYQRVRRLDLWQARTALELSAVDAAAERIDDTGIGYLQGLLETEAELIEQGVDLGHARHMHAAIADIAGNPASKLFIEVLAQLDEAMVHEHWAAQEGDPRATRQSDASHHAHVRIVDAIVAGDRALAQHRMRRHLDAIIKLINEDPGSSPA